MGLPHPSWNDIEEAVRSPTPPPKYFQTPKNPPEPGWHTNDVDVTDFGPSRLDDDVEVVGCRDCGKVVLRDALGFHRQNCQLIRAIAEREISPSIIEGESASSLSRKRNLSEASDSSFDHVGLADSKEKLSKKARKALEVEARKKARLEAKEAAKQGKANKRKKGPTDVDTQCGVINDKGLPCSRSLTCKSHSMGAKRAVPGRSRPYDELLLDWQRIHNPALVAKLEEKERALAASKAAAAERKHRKAMEKKKAAAEASNRANGGAGASGKKKLTSSPSKSGASDSAAAMAAANGDVRQLAKMQEDPEADMFVLGFTDEEIDVEIRDLVQAIRAVATSERTRILPLASQSFAGMYTRKAHMLRGCRDLLREGLKGTKSASNVLFIPNAPSLMAAQSQS